MLSLALLRHAKSSWDDPGLEDFDRPLNARGRAAAPVMGQVLRELQIAPDLILCSSSKRTRETLDLLGTGFVASDIRIFEDELYLTSAPDLLARIQSIEPGPRSVLIIGHNPGLHSFAVMMAGSGDAKSLVRLEEAYPTGALAVFSFQQTSWRDVSPESGRLEAYVTPRDRA